jgi:site-specific DNA recombinase
MLDQYIKQITIWDDRITVELKSGVSIDVNA